MALCDLHTKVVAVYQTFVIRVLYLELFYGLQPPKDKAANKVRQLSGYIVFAAECRKDIQAEYPGSNFGEISRIVGNKVVYFTEYYFTMALRPLSAVV